MPQFSESSKSKLLTCNPILIYFFGTIIQFRDCTILQGYRGEEEQNAAFEAGKSQLKYPDSNHNKQPYSLAVDVAPYIPERGGVSFDTRDVIEFGQYCCGIRDALHLNKIIRWGGDWNMNLQSRDESFLDGFHWEVLI